MSEYAIAEYRPSRSPILSPQLTCFNCLEKDTNKLSTKPWERNVSSQTTLFRRYTTLCYLCGGCAPVGDTTIADEHDPATAGTPPPASPAVCDGCVPPPLIRPSWVANPPSSTTTNHSRVCISWYSPREETIDIETSAAAQERWHGGETDEHRSFRVGMRRSCKSIHDRFLRMKSNRRFFQRGIPTDTLDCVRLERRRVANICMPSMPTRAHLLRSRSRTSKRAIAVTSTVRLCFVVVHMILSCLGYLRFAEQFVLLRISPSTFTRVQNATERYNSMT